MDDKLLGQLQVQCKEAQKIKDNIFWLNIKLQFLRGETNGNLKELIARSATGSTYVIAGSNSSLEEGLSDKLLGKLSLAIISVLEEELADLQTKFESFTIEID